MKAFLAAFAIAAVTPLAAAQQQPARPNPTDPAAPVPAIKHDSAFDGYRGFREEPLAPWRDANDEAARAGGHVGIVGGAGRHTPSSGSPAAKPPNSLPQSAPGSAHGAAH